MKLTIGLTLALIAGGAGFLYAAFTPELRLPALTLGNGLGLVGLAVLVRVLVWHRQLSRAIAPRAESSPTRRRYPSVTVIRPVRGRDAGAAESFAAALDTGYPGNVETLFIFDDERDPGLPIARAVVAEYGAAGRPGRAEVVIAGAPPPARTGKLNAMVVGERLARGELIAFGDSDTRPDRHVLREIVDLLLASSENGSAFAPVLVHEAPQAAGDVFYALMQNAMYSPLAAWVAGERRELPFIVGQLMVFRREALRAIGGVESVQGQLVDDMAIGKRVHDAGFKNVMSRHPLHIATSGLTLPQFLVLFRRWMLFAKNGLPRSFMWRLWLQSVELAVALATLVAALATGHLVAALLPAAALVALGTSPLVLQRRCGGAPIPLRWAWAPLAFFIVAPYVLLRSLAERRVEWRGREYRLGTNAALVTAHRESDVVDIDGVDATIGLLG